MPRLAGCPPLKIPWPRWFLQGKPDGRQEEENWKTAERWADGLLKCITTGGGECDIIVAGLQNGVIIGTGSSTLVPFDTTEMLCSSAYTLESNGKITINTAATYLVFGQGSWAISGTGARQTWLRRDQPSSGGYVTLASDTRTYVAPLGEQFFYNDPGPKLVALSVGDQISMYVRHNAGADRVLRATDPSPINNADHYGTTLTIKGPCTCGTAFPITAPDG